MQNYLGYYYASLVVITVETRYKYILISVQQNSFNAAIHVFLKIFKVTSCTIIYIYKYIYIKKKNKSSNYVAIKLQQVKLSLSDLLFQKRL